MADTCLLSPLGFRVKECAGIRLTFVSISNVILEQSSRVACKKLWQKYTRVFIYAMMVKKKKHAGCLKSPHPFS